MKKLLRKATILLLLSGAFFGSKAQVYPAATWVKATTGGNGTTMATAVDASGNVYMAGFFTGNLILSGTTLTNAGNADMMMAKYNSAGTLQWAFNMGGTGADQINGMIIDASGNIYVAGVTASSTWDADPSSNTNNTGTVSGTDIFVAKYDGTLTPSSTSFYKWAFTAGGNSTDWLSAMTIDASGNVYVAGYSQSSAGWDADPSTGTVTVNATAGGTDQFIAKYDGTLTPSNTSFCKWAFKQGGTGSEGIVGIAVDPSGNVYVGGNIGGSTTWDADPSSNTNNVTNTGGNDDLFLAKYDGTLTPANTSFYKWAFTMGGNDVDQVAALAVNSSGSVFVSGYTQSTNSWDTDPSSNTNNVSSVGSADQFLFKYDGTLTPSNTSFLKWGFTVGGTNHDQVIAMALDANDQVYLVGQTTSSTAWDADPSSGTHTVNSSSVSNTDDYISKYDGSLAPSSTSFFKYAFAFGSTSADRLFSVSAKNGVVAIGGYVTGANVDFQPGNGTAKYSSASSGSAISMLFARYVDPVMWNGGTSTAWTTGSNWQYSNAPNTDEYAHIPASGVTNEPTLSSSVTIAGITADAGRTITLSGSSTTLTVADPVTNNATFAGTGKLSLAGSTAQVVDGTGTVGNIELNNSTGATVSSGSNKLNITGLLTLTSGTLTTNSNLVLKSTGASTAAMVGQVPASGASVSGNVVHERYLSAPGNTSGGRSWRLLTSPLANNSTDNSIYYHWQNNGVSDGTTGIELFSPSGTGSAGNGIAAGGVYPSIRSYDYVTNTYSAVTNTKTTMLFTGTKNNTYLTFVPGTYGSGNITSGSGATNAHSTGTLITGTQNYSFTSPSAANKYYLMGNPFACPIDFDKMYNNTGTANINRKFWVIDPNLSSIGAYVTVTYTGSAYVTSTGAQNQYIQTGQGFFVESASPTVLSTVAVEENDKETSAAQTAVFRTNGGNLETFRAKLYKNNVLLDGAVVAGHQTSNNAVDGVDGLKFANFNENIGILTSGQVLAIDARQLLDNNDTVNITLSAMQQTTYQLVLEPGNMSASGLTATLIDNFTNTTTPVSLSGSTTYNFTVTSSTASIGTDRFKVVFKTIAPLDIKFVSTNAIKHNDKVDVQWTVANQDGIRNYDIERSSDAKSFSALGTVTAGSDAIYSFTDQAPLNGNNFYRIKAIARSNDHGVYSNVVRVNMNNANADVTVYPNPVKDGLLQISIANLAKGNYTISLYNAAGQKAITKQVAYDAGGASIDMNITSLATGIYLMQLTNENAETIAEQKIIKQ